MLAEQGVTAQVTKSELWSIKPAPTPETWLGWHNRNSVIPALMQPVNSLKAHSPKATGGCPKQFLAAVSKWHPAPHPVLHEVQVTTTFQDLPAQGLEEAHGRRNSLHASTSRAGLNKAQCPCAGLPHCCHQENQSNEEKKPTSAVISDHQVLSHLFLVLRGSDPWLSLC